jgi:hypothetical protein
VFFFLPHAIEGGDCTRVMVTVIRSVTSLLAFETLVY